MGEQRVPVFVPIAPVVIGALFVVLALARPAFFWNIGKVRMGREWLGDGGMMAAFVVLGLVLIIMGVVLLLKR